jgi:hypothetical protein
MPTPSEVFSSLVPSQLVLWLCEDGVEYSMAELYGVVGQSSRVTLLLGDREDITKEEMATLFPQGHEQVCGGGGGGFSLI